MAQSKSSRERAAEIKSRRGKRAKKLKKKAAEEAMLAKGAAPVNTGLLAPDSSYGLPEFVLRGFYIDRDFECKDCGKQEVWRATQQKWWYEVAKGNVWTEAVRCRSCRQRERRRIAEQRQASEEGRRRKANRIQ